VIDRYGNVRTVAAVGIGLGVLAFVLTMPPFTAVSEAFVRQCGAALVKVAAGAHP